MRQKLQKRARQMYHSLELSYGRRVVQKNGFWFIDIPRTSSTSIRYELAQAFGATYGKHNVDQIPYRTRQIHPSHRTTVQMSQILGPDIWQDLYKFTVVRNPFARVFSMYHYRQKRGKLKGLSFHDYVLLLGDPKDRSGHFAFQGHRYGLSDYLLGTDGGLDVTFVAKYEDRKNHLAQVGEKIGLPSLGQAWIQNATPEGAHYSEFYTVATRNIVEQRYKQDLELFDYEFEKA